MPELPENPDLAWDLEEFRETDRAQDFVLQFETTLCVYSPSVEQLYTTYNMYFPTSGKLVILPDPAVFHDTFNFIQPDAVTATGLYIIPGELIDKTGLHLANVNEDRTLGKRQIPFEAGLRSIINKRPDDDPFLPILAKGDLREFEKSWPVLHLHRVRPEALPRLSDLDKSSIASVIAEKLETLFITQQKVAEA
ncbi:MAG: hypothetical protein V3R27_02710 [Pseudomonadales bacterium]